MIKLQSSVWRRYVFLLPPGVCVCVCLNVHATLSVYDQLRQENIRHQELLVLIFYMVRITLH